MEFKPAASLPTQAGNQHRRQRILLIWLPLGMAVTLLLGLAVWLILTAGSLGPALTKWSDISTIWLILPLFFAGLIFFSLLCVLIYLNLVIYRKLPVLDRRVMAVFHLIQSGVRRGADKTVDPIYSVKGWSASVQALLNGLFRR
ncbi:MAG TPA: hypothetical protein VN452_08705 [Longilinea sp.]|nr:hypothetical protein [Longilinea sp.]